MIPKINKRKLFEFIIILILGLIPLLWFRGSEVILGHDSGLTLLPIPHFLDRLYAWTERFAFGSDQTYAIAGFFIHGLDALISSLGFGLQNVQKISFIFWFVMPGLAMFYFASKLEKRLNIIYLALPASTFYMLNHFLLQGWFVAERTKFSLYVALPLILSFLFDWQEKKFSLLKTALLISITLFFLNGEASPPLFGGMILTVGVFFIFYLIQKLSWGRLISIFKLVTLTGIISVVLNAYWLFSYGNYILHFYSKQVATAGGILGIKGWIDYVSQNSSIINLIRLQGVPEWYQNPLHPYAHYFFSNPLLIVTSFLIPILAFLPLWIFRNSEKKYYILFFSFLALFSIIFVAGSHEPFGAFYLFLINFVPGFIAFRTPFYKFAPALWFSYSILIGITISYFIQKIKWNFFIKPLIYLVICAAIILYSFPFLTGSFFNYMVGERSMKVNVPQYVFDFGKWSETPSRRSIKTLVLPPPNFDNNVDAYNWGYWSLAPLTSLFTNAPIINLSLYMSSSESNLVKRLYTMMKHNDPGWQNLAKLLGVKSFLLRNDFDSDAKGSPTDKPSDYIQALHEGGVKLVRKIGKWDVYDLTESHGAGLIVSSKINYLIGSPEDIAKITTLPLFDSGIPVYVSDISSDINMQDFVSITENSYIVPQCITCDLQRQYINTDSYESLITRNSILYPLLKIKDTINKITKGTTRTVLYESLKSILSLRKGVGNKESSDKLLLVLSDYQASLNNLDNSLSKTTNNYKNKDNNLFLETSEVLRTEKIIIEGFYNNISSSEVINSLNDRYDSLQALKGKVDSNLWRTEDISNKRFLFNVEKTGNYSFNYRPNQVMNNSSKIDYSLDGEKHTVNSPESREGWISLGALPLSQGIHRLEIYQEPFELYAGVKEPVISAANNSCFASNKVYGRKGDTYRIAFSHQRLYGDSKFKIKILDNNDRDNLLDSKGDTLSSTTSLNYYQTDHSLGEDGFFYFVICNVGVSTDNIDNSSIFLKNIVINKISVPEVVFSSSSKNMSKVVKIENAKKSQDEYKFSNREPKGKYAIMLYQSFNRNWTLNGSTSNHIMLNGFANGWITSSDNVDIRYDSQSLVRLGFIVTGIAFLIAVGALVVIEFKK